jgi:hypothetical protein
LVVGVAKCSGHQTFSGMPWVVAITLPEMVVLSPVTSLRNQTIICGVVFWLALTLVLLLVSTQVVSPLTRTSEVAKLMLDEQSGINFIKSVPLIYINIYLIGGYASSSTIEECAQEQDELVGGLWMRDEVYVLCKIVRVLARTFAQQKLLAHTMEQRVLGRQHLFTT